MEILLAINLLFGVPVVMVLTARAVIEIVNASEPPSQNLVAGIACLFIGTGVALALCLYAMSVAWPCLFWAEKCL